MTTPNANEFIGSASLSGDEASVASNMTAMMARVDERQAESERFIVENGAAVIGGHSPVGSVPPTDSTPMSGDVFNPTDD